MTQLRRLMEADATNRLDVAIKNLDTTIKTIRSIIGSGVVPTSEQLMAIWQADDDLKHAYGDAEKARAKK